MNNVGISIDEGVLAHKEEIYGGIQVAKTFDFDAMIKTATSVFTSGNVSVTKDSTACKASSNKREIVRTSSNHQVTGKRGILGTPQNTSKKRVTPVVKRDTCSDIPNIETKTRLTDISDISLKGMTVGVRYNSIVLKKKFNRYGYSDTVSFAIGGDNLHHITQIEIKKPGIFGKTSHLRIDFDQKISGDYKELLRGLGLVNEEHKKAIQEDMEEIKGYFKGNSVILPYESVDEWKVIEGFKQIADELGVPFEVKG